jgi:hypothetical protein
MEGSHRISSRGRPTKDGPPAWRLGEGLTTHRKEQLVTECYAGTRI